jgi:two-component system phosphate regulon response regulator PhoB
MKRAYILIVEPMSKVAQALAQQLQHEGYHTEHMPDAISARKHVGHGNIPDVMIIDWMLPKHSPGIELVRELRREMRTKYVPMILMSSPLSTKTSSLPDQEAQETADYVSQYFSSGEIVRRIRWLLRRYPMHHRHNAQKFGPIALDAGQRSVSYQEQYIILPPTEFRLMLFLAEHPDYTFSREDLMLHIWGEDNDLEARTVDSHIKKLRQFLEQLGMEGWIETIRGLGYRYTPQNLSYH